jgi:hypothetical protein
MQTDLKASLASQLLILGMTIDPAHCIIPFHIAHTIKTDRANSFSNINFHSAELPFQLEFGISRVMGSTVEETVARLVFSPV